MEPFAACQRCRTSLYDSVSPELYPCLHHFACKDCIITQVAEMATCQTCRVVVTAYRHEDFIDNEIEKVSMRIDSSPNVPKEELIQEAYVRIFEHIRGLKPEERPAKQQSFDSSEAVHFEPKEENKMLESPLLPARSPHHDEGNSHYEAVLPNQQTKKDNKTQDRITEDSCWCICFKRQAE